jgi:hypothetical protein
MQHNIDISIGAMLKSRLPFLTVDDLTSASIPIVEVMAQLNLCFKVEEINIGNEDFYTISYKSLIADVVACTILLQKFAVNMDNADTYTTGTSGRVIRRTKAGSVEVEFEDESSETASKKFITTAVDLYNKYMDSAKAKALKLGCVLDMSDTGLVNLIKESNYELPLFRIIV